jgi:hypothetical protein
MQPYYVATVYKANGHLLWAKWGTSKWRQVIKEKNFIRDLS